MHASRPLNSIFDRSCVVFGFRPISPIGINADVGSVAGYHGAPPDLAHFKLGFPLPATCGPENYGLFPFLLYFLGLPRFRVPVFQTRRGNVSQGFARTQPIYIEAGRPGGLVGILINEPSGRQVMGSSSGDSDYYEFFSRFRSCQWIALKSVCTQRERGASHNKNIIS